MGRTFLVACQRHRRLLGLLALSLGSACGAPPTVTTRTAVVKPTAAELALCQGFAERIAACSHGALSASPNDAPRCGTMLASHDASCRVAFENLVACARGVTCAHLAQGACLANFSVSTAVCEGFVKPETYSILGLSLP